MTAESPDAEDEDEDEKLQFLAVMRDGTDSGRRYALADVLREAGIDPE